MSVQTAHIRKRLVRTYVTFPNKDKKAPTKSDVIHCSFSWGQVLSREIMGLGTKVLSLCEQTSRRGTRRLIKWLKKHRLIKTRMKCRLCKKQMKFQRTQTGDGYQW